MYMEEPKFKTTIMQRFYRTPSPNLCLRTRKIAILTTVLKNFCLTPNVFHANSKTDVNLIKFSQFSSKSSCSHLENVFDKPLIKILIVRFFRKSFAVTDLEK